MRLKTSPQDHFTLYNGVTVPALGYGTFQSEDEAVGELIRTAVDIGYRHIDTASMYKNERGVGEGIRSCGLPREELFVTTKVWNANRSYEKVMESFKESMEKLDIGYLDLLLIHWPANRKMFGEDAPKINADTWAAFEELYREKKVRAIGVSNFRAHHLSELMEMSEMRPMVDQIEFHPGFAHFETLAFCRENEIVNEAWSPLGRKMVLENETLTTLAEKYGKTSAQICLRWEVQHDILPLPKSGSPDRIRSNTEIYDFELDQDDMEIIDALPPIGGQCIDPDQMPI